MMKVVSVDITRKIRILNAKFEQILFAYELNLTIY
jgi:hypothetical protein